MDNQIMRVSWCPQVGSSNWFHIPVHSVEEAKKIMDVLAFYDCFLYNNNVRGDYCNSGNLEVLNEETSEWDGWCYDDIIDYFDDVDEYVEARSPDSEMLDADAKEMAAQVDFDY